MIKAKFVYPCICVFVIYCLRSRLELLRPTCSGTTTIGVIVARPSLDTPASGGLLGNQTRSKATGRLLAPCKQNVSNHELYSTISCINCTNGDIRITNTRLYE